jgi:DNA replication protein DnaC
MESSGMTTPSPQPDLPLRPERADFAGRNPMAWLNALKEWQQHPLVVAHREQQKREEEARIEQLRPAVACPDCRAHRTEDPRHPWTIIQCGPHRVDTLMSHAAAYPNAVTPIPRRYAHADPNHLIPALRAWDGTTGLYLTGPVGTGKTYQAAALVRLRFRTFDPPRLDAYYDQRGYGFRPVVWANVPKLLEDVRRSFDAPDVAPSGLEHAPLLVLDDIGAEKPSEWVEERLYCVVNERYERELPVIVTSNLTPSQLGGRVGARLASRLREMCDMHGLGGRDRRLKAAS